MDVSVDHGVDALSERTPETVVDTLVGDGLEGPLRRPAAALVAELDPSGTTVVSFDVPYSTPFDENDWVTLQE